MNRKDPIYLRSPTPDSFCLPPSVRHPNLVTIQAICYSWIFISVDFLPSFAILISFLASYSPSLLFTLLSTFSLSPSLSLLSHLADYLGISTSTTPERSSRDWTNLRRPGSSKFELSHPLSFPFPLSLWVLLPTENVPIVSEELTY